MRTHLLLAMVALALEACGTKDAKPDKETKSKGAASEGAMCEHGVLEAICTKCNPKLVAVFKAKGDYCEEHGFPMSVCPIHHPERGGRPVANVATDKAPPDGTKVRLKTQDTARLAGIKVVPAERRPGGARLEALASIAYDATKWAQVNARAAGVVRAVKVDVGTMVKAGTPIAIIESASVGADRSRLQASASRVAVAEANLKREKELLQQGIAAQKTVLAAQQELDAAKAEQASAGAALGVIGPSAGASSYVLAAPIAGVVTKRNVTIGHMVGADNQVLFEIVDTSSMRAEIEIPETELRRVRVGQEVVVTTDALPGSEFKGTIDYIAPEVARETRTIKARATLANPEATLRANMFGRARIALGGTEETVLVPRMAVQRVDDVDLVFVKLAEGEYEARRVKTGVREGDRVEITQGIKPDEQVVTEGSFLLKTETLKGSIGAGCCE
ncbi:MAG: efflux RND transporter periplasmic adaptor subunit [Deltaproteobacteria bacterium]|nr:efflux RND transporter periplasmic adaptor subunit [Deltaproteobacteria bacterium]